jgi:hypothetical protein
VLCQGRNRNPGQRDLTPPGCGLWRVYDKPPFQFSDEMNAPEQSKFDCVIEKQQAPGGRYNYQSLANQIVARVQAGKDRATAFSEVIEYWAARTNEEIDRKLSGADETSS